MPLRKDDQVEYDMMIDFTRFSRVQNTLLTTTAKVRLSSRALSYSPALNSGKRRREEGFRASKGPVSIQTGDRGAEGRERGEEV